MDGPATYLYFVMERNERARYSEGRLTGRFTMPVARMILRGFIGGTQSGVSYFYRHHAFTTFT
jgi:hypothetical protein